MTISANEWRASASNAPLLVMVHVATLPTNIAALTTTAVFTAWSSRCCLAPGVFEGRGAGGATASSQEEERPLSGLLCGGDRDSDVSLSLFGLWW